METRKQAIAIPTSVISDTPHLREKTSKIGLIARTAAIFKINQIIIYPSNPRKTNQKKDAALIALLLAYMETPQYLRKRLFKLDPQLKFAGILPPLRTPHHPLNRKTKKLKIGEYREGVTLSRVKEGMLVDIGVEQPALMRETNWAEGKRLTLQIVNAGERIEVQTARRDDIPSYWGYTVTLESRSFRKFIENEKFDLVIATSKLGTNFMDVAGKIGEKWKKSQRVLMAFGAPTRGLYKIVKDEGANLDNVVDFVVNTVPEQGTETVRTEEALLASLAIFNAQFRV